jgi:hypothetical protein
MSRQSIVAPIGLVTQPAKYGQYKRGALSVATNVVMRSPGVISSMPGVTLYRSASGTVSLLPRLIHSGASSLLVYIEDAGVTTYRLNWATSGSLVVAGVPNALWDPRAIAGRVRMATQRGRFFLTSWNTTLSAVFRGVAAWDSEGSSSPRMSGLSPVSYTDYGGATSTDAVSMADDTCAGWRAIIRRKQADGYELVSAASAPNALSVQPAAGGPFDFIFKIGFPMHHNYAAGDFVELYRTRTVTPYTTSPGDRMQLAVSQVITAGDVANGYVTVRDSCPDDALGVDLYSNSGQETSAGANYDPPASSDMCGFKGHMFYAATAVPAQATVGPRVAYGPLSTNSDRIYGIGVRNTTGTTSSGSPTITAVVNMRGIVAGQKLFCANFPGGVTSIVSVTATTITCVANANASSTLTVATEDVINVTVSGLVTSELALAMGFAASFDDFAIAAVAGYSANGVNGSPFVYVSGLVDDLFVNPARGQEYIFRLPRVYAGGSFTLRATNGINYSPPLPEISATANTYTPDVRENRLAWSKFQQPEHVPPLNFTFVGSGTLYRMVPTRDALWLFCSDGLYRLSGDGGDGDTAWRVDLADPNLILSARNAAASLKETVWAYTNRGLVAISDDGGIQEISLGVIGDTLVGANFSDTWETFMSVDQLHQEVWLTFRASPSNSTTYIFNTITKTFVKFSNADYSVSEWAPYLQSLVLGKFTSGAVPELYTFNADTSSSRMTGADVRFQPLFVSDPFDMKQFQSVTYAFEGVNAAATITPVFDDVDSVAFACNQSAGESRATAGVPRRCAIAPVLRPGFKMSNVAAPWSFRGISAKYTPGGEETERD